MKHFLKRSLALICMLALLVGITPLSLTASAAEVGEFTVLSTTDMHGRCWDTNVLNDDKTTNSMLNVATAVAGIRAEKENVILLDNGDTYQGEEIHGQQLLIPTIEIDKTTVEAYRASQEYADRYSIGD